MTEQRIFLSPPHMGGRELELVHEAFGSNYVAPVGPMMDAFEREFAGVCGIPHCVALSSGTAAMHLALRHLLQGAGGRKQGSAVEAQSPLVLASTLTFIGSVSPAVFEGCEITFIDCDRETWNMDPVLLEEELTYCAAQDRLPAAVIPTDLYGQCCDLPRIIEICDRHGVPVICDSAEAVGARCRGPEVGGQESGVRGQESGVTGWVHAGFGAWASVYSFNGNKIITSSGGGMLASHDRELIDHARKLATQARDAAPWYEHSEIGYNYRMSNIVAAIGLGQLEVLDERVARKREICAQYEARLGSVPGITFMPEASYGQSNRWLTVILIDPAAFGADTHAVREALEQENIEARPVWKPMHLQPVFEGCRVRGGAVGEELFRMGLCLPSGTAMGDDDLARVCAVVLRCRG
jgi:dTDP-4-amino-4,6-dideoxygalactose transaminase